MRSQFAAASTVLVGVEVVTDCDHIPRGDRDGLQIDIGGSGLETEGQDRRRASDDANLHRGHQMTIDGPQESLNLTAVIRRHHRGTNFLKRDSKLSKGRFILKPHSLATAGVFSSASARALAPRGMRKKSRGFFTLESASRPAA